MNNAISPKFSFQGWNLKKLLVGNKNALKIIVGAVVSLAYLYPSMAGWIVTAGGVTAVVTYILNVIDFYSSEVKLTS